MMRRLRHLWRARRPGVIRYLWRNRQAERRILEQQGRLMVTVRYRDAVVRDVPLDRVQATVAKLLAEHGPEGTIHFS
jgi:hypothetical protein